MLKIIKGVGILSALIVAGVALANPPSITVDQILDMEFAAGSFPQAYVIMGDVTHDSATGPGVKNVCRLTRFTVTVDDGVNPASTLLDTVDPTTLFGWSPVI